MKRSFALILAVFMLAFSLSVSAADFSDMPQKDSPLYDAFEYAIGKKLVSGANGKLNPDGKLTYAETVTILSRMKNIDAPETDITAFGVSKDKWYYSAVAKAYTAGYFSDSSKVSNPDSVISEKEVRHMFFKTFGVYANFKETDLPVTRATLVYEIYMTAPDGYKSKTEAVEQPTGEAATEAPTEFSDLKAKAAQEAKQLALGILPDGTSYVDNVVYIDYSHTNWYDGTGSSSSRPSSSNRPGNNRPNKPDDETEAPTEDDIEQPTQPPTEMPTEPETEAPTYDGPIDNDNDNVVKDPFDDGWTPNNPGGNGGNGGNGGYDDEDEDFTFNDADDPDYIPPTDNETESETAPSESDSEDVSETETAPSDSESEDVSETETAPSDSESEDASEDMTDTPSILPSEDKEDTPTTPENGDGDNLPEENPPALMTKEW